ncbi:MAG TPA: CinA family protein, partial [Candidatus Nanopelagicales bacterium]|nr:CinA family protein [Candidatus Nanopelagicales bacterium]
LLGVDATLLAARGPVDPQVARAMAAGAARACGATYGVATTGVAGPDRQGGAAVGTVYVAVAGPGVDRAESLALPGDRAAVRAGAVTAALDLLLAILPPPPGR